jgi:ABC-type uncharacterized transport system fused permease/ATPase subunit
MAMAKQNLMRDAWSIARTYWTSEEKWSAWGLLLAIVGFNLGTVCTSVGLQCLESKLLQCATGIRAR